MRQKRYDSDVTAQVAQRFVSSGYDDVRVYHHFVDEWSADESLPMDRLARYRQLVSPQWVKQLIETSRAPEYDNDRFVVCHAHYRNRTAYDEGHIPGAVQLDTNWLESPETWNRRSPEEIEQTLGRLGITSDTTVVLYGKFSFPSNDDPFPGSSAGHLGAIRCAFIMMYAGVRDVRVLNGGLQSWIDEGYEVVLVNSNPATIMTDPMTADKVYLRDLTPAEIKRIVLEEQPDAVVPTMGGQTALNLAETLQEEGFWQEQGVDVIGVDIEAIQITEDRQRFRDLMEEIGIDQARSRTAKSLLEAKEITQELGGLPVVIRPSYTLGGSGGGIVWTHDEFDRKVTRGLEMSPVHQVLIEECLFGWKEYELELLRDANDNVIIICSIENVDPMGVHTGDSVTVAPAQTLTDKQFQQMRDAAIRAMRSIGTFAGGCNIQFAFEPQTGRMIVIEINPRVSRSSALASKATGYPIAKVASRLAVGYTLDELPNEVTGNTSACFEPAIDYVVTKIPRFNFEKFEGVDEELTTQMKAVGEVMAIGRTFPESLQKAWQSLEIGYAGLGADREEVTSAELKGLPLILLATFFSRLGTGSRFWQIVRGRGFEVRVGPWTLYLHTTSIASGVLLILMGTLLATGHLTWISERAQSSAFSQWVIGLEDGIRQFFNL